MPLSEARKRANAKYNAKAYDRIEFKVPKGEKERIQAYADQYDGSLNKFINRAVNEAVERSGTVGLPMDSGRRVGEIPDLYTDDMIVLPAAVAHSGPRGFPSRIHQKISVEITRQLANFLEGKDIEVYAAPFQIRFPNGGQESLMEPDITVVGDLRSLRDYGYCGVPQLVMEILSPDTARTDLMDKLQTYEKSGVPEYWVVSPGDKMIQVRELCGGFYKIVEIYGESDMARVRSLDGCLIECAKVFFY